MEAEKVATMELRTQREEADMDMKTIEEPPKQRRFSSTRAATAPPAQPRPPVPDLSEVHGPLYPVSRQHNYPKDTPARDESKTKDELKFPVYVAEGTHSFQEIPKSGEKVNTMTGPVLDVQHSHHFSKQETTVVENKSLQGPTYNVGVESKHGFNLMNSNQKPVAVNFAAEQKYPIMESSHKSDFTGPTTGIHSSNTEVKGIQYPTMMNKRRFNKEFSEHGFEPEANITSGERISSDLVGPVFDTDIVHHFKGLVTHAEQLNILSAPIYDSVERNHHFSELGKHAEALKVLNFPVFDVEKKHSFDIIMKEAEKLIGVTGPVYPVSHSSSYKPQSNKVDKEVLMTGPK